MTLYSQYPLAQAGALISSIGTEGFSRSLLAEINGIVPVSHITVFTFENADAVTPLVTEGDVENAQARELANAYSGHFFKRDPNLPRIYANRDKALPQWLAFPRTAGVGPRYYRYFFANANLADKVSLVFSARGVVFYCNFYRIAGLPPFSGGDRDKLKQLTNLFLSCLERHRAFLGQGAHPAPRLAKLTDRESDVCSLIVSGHSSEAIAIRLGLSINSVKTYRKRAYAKLAISSQNELFHLMVGRH